MDKETKTTVETDKRTTTVETPKPPVETTTTVETERPVTTTTTTERKPA